MRFFFLFVLFLSFNLNFAQLSDFKHIDFTKADNVAKRNSNMELDNLPLLAHQLSSGLETDVEKFRAIFLWICNTIKVDVSQSDKIIYQREKFKNDSLAFMAWNNAYKKTMFKKLLTRKKTMCTGFAYLIKELCFLSNIECVIVDGYGRSPKSNVETLEMANHSWNAVKLNDKWYLCDPNWATGFVQNGSFKRDYNNGYFLTDPVLFAKNHFPIDKKWLLNATTSELNFTNHPIVYGETFKHGITQIAPQKLQTVVNKGDIIEFSFKALENIDNNKVSLVLFFGSSTSALKIYNFKTENGITTFSAKFNYKGTYDVHLKINDDVVATYVIKVVKA